MKITGKFIKDQNSITVFTDDTMYSIACNGGDWGCRRVGELLTNGFILTREWFEKEKAKCTKEGTFELKEELNEIW